MVGLETQYNKRETAFSNYLIGNTHNIITWESNLFHESVGRSIYWLIQDH
jgi:hypothetical protein